jgi:hypothetical protein
VLFLFLVMGCNAAMEPLLRRTLVLQNMMQLINTRLVPTNAFKKVATTPLLLYSTPLLAYVKWDGYIRTG